MPADSTFNRFLYVIQFLARNGLYIILDNQFNFDTTAITNTPAWVQARSPAALLRAWTAVLDPHYWLIIKHCLVI